MSGELDDDQCKVISVRKNLVRFIGIDHKNVVLVQMVRVIADDDTAAAMDHIQKFRIMMHMQRTDADGVDQYPDSAHSVMSDDFIFNHNNRFSSYTKIAGLSIGYLNNTIAQALCVF